MVSSGVIIALMNGGAISNSVALPSSLVSNIYLLIGFSACLYVVDGS